MVIRQKNNKHYVQYFYTGPPHCAIIIKNVLHTVNTVKKEVSMTTKELIDSGLFEVVHAGEQGDRKISTPFCCDLLSLAMGKAPRDCAWITVMGNGNTLAVASLVHAACVIFAEGIIPNESVVKTALEHEITVLKTDMPVFEAAMAVHQMAANDPF